MALAFLKDFVLCWDYLFPWRQFWKMGIAPETLASQTPDRITKTAFLFQFQKNKLKTGKFPSILLFYNQIGINQAKNENKEK
ncbi:MAG: hypothetical protein WCR02_01110 [Sphaerochaetaceae bacterium]